MSQVKTHPFQILRRSLVWFGISLSITAIGIAKLAINNAQTGEALNYGIDFKGGAAYVYKFPERIGDSAAEVIGKVRAVCDQVGIERPSIQEFPAGFEVQVRTLTGSTEAETSMAQQAASSEADAILQALRAEYGNVELVGSELVGPVIGEYLRRQGSIALVLGCALILFYIAIRYNISGVGGRWLFGACAVVALVHDVFIMITAVALAGIEINSSFIAAVLTIVGYSVNDTVIIFDRIRENLRNLDTPQRRNLDAVEAAMETSLWQTMVRSLMTVGTTLMPLLMLLFFGGVTIKAFAFALTIGILCGAYSSIFTASPLVLFLLRRAHAKQAADQPARPAPRPRPQAAAPAPRRAEAPKPAAAPRPAGTEPAQVNGDEPKPGAAKKRTTAKKKGGKRRY